MNPNPYPLYSTSTYTCRVTIAQRICGGWVGIIDCANLGMEVMHERNAHNFPLDLASVEAPSTNR